MAEASAINTIPAATRRRLRRETIREVCLHLDAVRAEGGSVEEAVRALWRVTERQEEAEG